MTLPGDRALGEAETVGPEVAGLVRLSRVLAGVADRSLQAASAQVSLAQFRALVVLARTDPCSAGELATALGLIGSTTTRLCDKLLALGWITRTDRAADRRTIELALTRSGRALVEQVLAVRDAELERILTHLPHQSRARLAAVLPPLLSAADDVVVPARASWAI